MLAADGFKWTREGALTDPEGRPVEFSILTSNSNPERSQMATLIQDDLKQIGMRVNVVPLEFRSLLDRVQHTHDFEACVLSLASADADPNPGYGGVAFQRRQSSLEPCAEDPRDSLGSRDRPPDAAARS